MALTTSRTGALQARRSCASSLDTLTQSFLHRAWQKTRGLEIGSWSALVVVAHAFSLPPARLRHVRGGVGRRRSLISSPSGRLAACPNQRSLLCTSKGGDAVPRMAHSLCALRVECGGCCHCQRTPTSFHRLLVQATSRSRRVKLNALLPGRPYPLYATIFHAATKDRIADERMRNEQDYSCF